VAAIVLVTLFLACLILILYVHSGGKEATSGATAGKVLRGTPLKLDEKVMRARVKQDVAPLLVGDYNGFYAKLGYKKTATTSVARQDFQTIVGGLEVSGGCVFTVSNIDTKQGGGLDGRPNSVTLSGPVVCAASSYQLRLEYFGNGAHPETFGPYKFVIASGRNASFADAVARAHDARGNFIASDKSTPSHTLYLSALDRTTAEAFAANGIAGSNCVLEPAATASIELIRALGGDAFLVSTVNYYALCDAVKVRS
jgi:hypothetical protein